jgi:hypothetical protein
VLVNLVVNAGDAMPNGGTLTIETAPADLDDHFAELHPGMAAVLYAELTASDMARTGSCSRSRAPPGGQAPTHPFPRGSSLRLGVASGPGRVRSLTLAGEGEGGVAGACSSAA